MKTCWGVLAVVAALAGASAMVVSEARGGHGEHVAGRSLSALGAPGTGTGVDREMNALGAGLRTNDLQAEFLAQTRRGIYGMGSDAGDRRVAGAVARIAADVRSGRLKDMGQVSAVLSKALDRLDHDGYGMAWDTVVTDHVLDALEGTLNDAGMSVQDVDLNP